MKTKIINFDKKDRLIALIIFLITISITYPQEKKIVKTPQIDSLDQLGYPQSIANEDDNKYKLVFPVSYDGSLNWKFGEYDQMIRSERNSFVEQLNQFGSKGYKLISAIREFPVAIVKLDESQYQYIWFETISPFDFTKSGFQEKQAEMAKQDFHVVEHFFISRSCEPLYAEDISLGEKCQYKDLFLFEKQKDFKKPFEQILVNAFPGWGAKPSVDLEMQVDEKLAEGFYPTKVFSAFEILLMKAKDKNDLLSDKPDVRIVRSSWGNTNLEDKVNELAKKGYRLAMAQNGIAVMYRNSETAQIPVLYVWVKADKKNFEKELAKLQAKGAIYRTTYPNEKGTENNLIFEQKLKDDGKRREFRILKFEFDSKENKQEKKVYIDLMPSSKEAIKTMNKLVKEGFEVKDLFYTDKVSVILERTIL